MKRAGEIHWKTSARVATAMLQLKNYGIVDYSPQTDTPQLTLVLNRMYADSFVINLENYLQRKKNFERRTSEMAAFITNTIICRSQQIAIYFNDLQVKPCGICDNCINLKVVELSSEEFASITRYIFELVKDRPLAITQLMMNAGRSKKETIMEGDQLFYNPKGN